LSDSQKNGSREEGGKSCPADREQTGSFCCNYMSLQVACVERVRSNLLKTSKMLRQQHGLQKETKVREYETLYLLEILRFCGVG